MPRMQDILNKVAQYNNYSTVDLKSAYHPITLPVDDRKNTAIEANGQLFQCTRMPFGLRNAMPCFQRIINEIIEKNGCEGTFTYLNNVTVAGKTQNEPDANLKKFLSIAKEYNISVNEQIFLLM